MSVGGSQPELKVAIQETAASVAEEDEEDPLLRAVPSTPVQVRSSAPSSMTSVSAMTVSIRAGHVANRSSPLTRGVCAAVYAQSARSLGRSAAAVSSASALGAFRECWLHRRLLGRLHGCSPGAVIAQAWMLKWTTPPWLPLCLPPWRPRLR